MPEPIVFSNQEHFVSEVDETGLGAVDAVADDSAPSSVWGETWKSLRGRPLFWVAFFIILLMSLLAAFPGLFTSLPPDGVYDLNRQDMPPSAGHIFGFDHQGCDIFARTVYGTRVSVLVGVLATLTAVFIGTVFGALAGLFGGVLDAILSRITDIFFAVPLVLAAIVVMQMFHEHRGIFSVVFVLGVFGWPPIARIARGAVMGVKHEEYVTAARSVGASRGRILRTHILPNAAAPIIVYATVALGIFIVAEATLSFLGIGLPPNVVSWGGDIARAQGNLRSLHIFQFYPALALALTVLSFIMMGDLVRDALDPKSRKR